MGERKYIAFSGFKEWEAIQVDAAKWASVLESNERWRAQPEAIARAVEWVQHRINLPLSELKSIYKLSPSLAVAVVMDLDLVDDITELNEGLISSVKDLMKAQAELYESLTDFTDNERPLTQADIRGLHALICAAQEHYCARTLVGDQEISIRKGEYKHMPNDVVQQDGSTHFYAPPDETPHEMRRLCDELQSQSFMKAHSVIQAAYVHHAFVTIHPFADGNGRTARALSSIYLFRGCGLPFLFSAEHRTEYLTALTEADRMNFSRFVRFVLGRTIDTAKLMDQVISVAQPPSIESIKSNLSKLFQQANPFGKNDIRIAASTLAERFTDVLEESLKAFTADIGGRYRLERNPPHRGVVQMDENKKIRYLSNNYRDLRVVEFSLASKVPALASVYYTFQVEIPIHSSAEDEVVLINARQQSTILAVRVADILPFIAKSTERLIEISVSNVLREVAVELNELTLKSLSEQGYLDL
jgi:fido (protein-threonine AMPylation protein)